MDNTQKLLTLLIILTGLLILTTTAQVAQENQTYKPEPLAGANNAMYAVDNPHLKEELHARILAPANAQGTPGAR